MPEVCIWEKWRITRLPLIKLGTRSPYTIPGYNVIFPEYTGTHNIPQ